MNFAQARKSKGWLLLLATVVGLGYGGYSFINNAKSSHIYTLDCGTLAYKPDVLFQACADGNIGVGKITWDSWSTVGASGEGEYAINNCRPDCASGKFFTSPVSITLTADNPIATVNGKKVLNILRIRSLDKKFLPFESTNTKRWTLE